MPDFDRALPYYRWYWKDWRANRRVQRLSWLQRGAYRELLDECWAEGWIPDDVKKLAEIVGCSTREMQEMWTVLRPLFSEDPDNPEHLTSTRLERERTEIDKVRVKRVKAGRKGGIASQSRRDDQGDLLKEMAPDQAHAKQSSYREGEESKGENEKEEELKANAVAIVDRWNADAKRVGYASVTSVTGERRRHLEARLNKPGWSARALKAIEYLTTDNWYVTHPSAIRFDTLLQDGKAEYYCERSEVPRAEGPESRGGARAEVDRGIHDALNDGAGTVREETTHA